MKLIALAALLAVSTVSSVSSAGPSSSSGAESARDLINTLQTRRISVKFESASLDDVVKYVRAAAGINIVVQKHKITKAGGDADAIEISMKVRNVTIMDFLKLAILPNELGMATKGNILLITSKQAARGKPVLRLYSIAHLLVQIRDFPAPDINVYPTGFDPPEAPEIEVHQAMESGEEVAEMLRNFVGADTWDDEGVVLHVNQKKLFIRQYPHVHRKIGRFLLQLNALR
jgi:hypothetical protein